MALVPVPVPEPNRTERNMVLRVMKTKLRFNDEIAIQQRRYLVAPTIKLTIVFVLPMVLLLLLLVVGVK